MRENAPQGRKGGNFLGKGKGKKKKSRPKVGEEGEKKNSFTDQKKKCTNWKKGPGNSQLLNGGKRKKKKKMRRKGGESPKRPGVKKRSSPNSVGKKKRGPFFLRTD